MKPVRARLIEAFAARAVGRFWLADWATAGLSTDTGEDAKSLTRNEVEELDLVWGPSGDIVFESRPAGRSELFVTDTDGFQSRLSVGDTAASSPDW